jgi:broad specificity phosphatase PhoE
MFEPLMRIGLMRHLPVAYRYRYVFAEDSNGFERELENYNQADVRQKRLKNLGAWDICYSSNLKRAVLTARSFYKGKIIITDLLREVPMKAVAATRLRIPLFLWFCLVRFSWYINGRSQPESISGTLKRARTFFKDFCLPNNDDASILVVSHGLFLLVLQKVLRRQGFKGKIFLRPNHATLYVFDKGRRAG